MELTVPEITLYIILAIVLAIVYSLRILVLLERRIARMDYNIERMTEKIAREEVKIETMISGRKKKKAKKKK